MIYESTRATIKHNFPRAVLMTWWERYFIKTTAPGVDTETQAVGTKRTKYCPLTSDSFVRQMVYDEDTRGRMHPSGQDMKRLRLLLHMAHLPLGIQIWELVWELDGSSRKAKLQRLQNSHWIAQQLLNEEGAFQLSFLSGQDCRMPESCSYNSYTSSGFIFLP